MIKAGAAEHQTNQIKRGALPEEKGRSLKQKARSHGKENHPAQSQKSIGLRKDEDEEACSEAEQSEGGQSGRSGISTTSGSKVSSSFSMGSISSGLSAGRSKEAKDLVKVFVRDMIRGRKMDVMMPSGQVRSCFCSLNRQLDTFRIKVGDSERKIPIKDIEQMITGNDSKEHPILQTIDTPLDDLCVTLALGSETCISFRMKDIEQRDTFIMCMMTFANAQRSPFT